MQVRPRVLSVIRQVQEKRDDRKAWGALLSGTRNVAEVEEVLRAARAVQVGVDRHMVQLAITRLSIFGRDDLARAAAESLHGEAAAQQALSRGRVHALRAILGGGEGWPLAERRLRDWLAAGEGNAFLVDAALGGCGSADQAEALIAKAEAAGVPTNAVLLTRLAALYTMEGRAEVGRARLRAAGFLTSAMIRDILLHEGETGRAEVKCFLARIALEGTLDEHHIAAVLAVDRAQGTARGQGSYAADIADAIAAAKKSGPVGLFQASTVAEDPRHAGHVAIGKDVRRGRSTGGGEAAQALRVRTAVAGMWGCVDAGDSQGMRKLIAALQEDQCLHFEHCTVALGAAKTAEDVEAVLEAMAHGALDVREQLARRALRRLLELGEGSKAQSLAGEWCSTLLPGDAVGELLVAEGLALENAADAPTSDERWQGVQAVLAGLAGAGLHHGRHLQLALDYAPDEDAALAALAPFWSEGPPRDCVPDADQASPPPSVRWARRMAMVCAARRFDKAARWVRDLVDRWAAQGVCVVELAGRGAEGPALLSRRVAGLRGPGGAIELTGSGGEAGTAASALIPENRKEKKRKKTKSAKKRAAAEAEEGVGAIAAPVLSHTERAILLEQALASRRWLNAADLLRPQLGNAQVASTAPSAEAMLRVIRGLVCDGLIGEAVALEAALASDAEAGAELDPLLRAARAEEGVLGSLCRVLGTREGLDSAKARRKAERVALEHREWQDVDFGHVFVCRVSVGALYAEAAGISARDAEERAAAAALALVTGSSAGAGAELTWRAVRERARAVTLGQSRKEAGAMDLTEADAKVLAVVAGVDAVQIEGMLSSAGLGGTADGGQGAWVTAEAGVLDTDATDWGWPFPGAGGEG